MKNIFLNKTIDIKRLKQKTNDRLHVIILFLVMLMGMIIGSIYILQLFSIDDNLILPLFNVPVTSQNLNIQTFAVSLISILSVVMLFISGFNALGKPFIIILILINGFFTGAIVTSYALQSGHYILIYTFFVVIPTFVIAIVALLCSGVQSIFLCNDLYDNLFRNVAVKTEIRTYLKRYILIVFLTISAIIYMLIAGNLFIIFT